MSCCPNYPHPKMAPGQTPYTCAELANLYGMVRDAADSDPGEQFEPELCRCGRHYQGIPCPEAP